jgi:TPR repeat protein
MRLVEVTFIVVAATVMFATVMLGSDDFTQAMKKCRSGDAEACCTVAVSLEFGTGVTADERKARKAYREACIKGSGIACRIIGHKSDGDGKAKDAAFYWDQGCRLRDEKSCQLLEAMKR